MRVFPTLLLWVLAVSLLVAVAAAAPLEQEGQQTDFHLNDVSSSPPLSELESAGYSSVEELDADAAAVIETEPEEVALLATSTQFQSHWVTDIVQNRGWRRQHIHAHFHFYDNPRACKQKCDIDRRCAGWLYWRNGGRMVECDLFTQIPSPVYRDVTFNAGGYILRPGGYWSGIKVPPSPPRPPVVVKAAPGPGPVPRPATKTDYVPNRLLARQHVYLHTHFRSALLCQQRCDSDSRCEAWNWVRGTCCELMHKIPTKSSHNSAWVSGVRKPPPPPPPPRYVPPPPPPPPQPKASPPPPRPFNQGPPPPQRQFNQGPPRFDRPPPPPPPPPAARTGAPLSARAPARAAAPAPAPAAGGAGAGAGAGARGNAGGATLPVAVARAAGNGAPVAKAAAFTGDACQNCDTFKELKNRLATIEEKRANSRKMIRDLHNELQDVLNDRRRDNTQTITIQHHYPGRRTNVRV